MTIKSKWWEVARTQDESDLFNILARDPDFTWREGSTLAKTLGWSSEKLEKVMIPYLDKNMILIRKGKTGNVLFAYWERVEQDLNDLQKATPKISAQGTSAVRSIFRPSLKTKKLPSLKP